MITDRSPAPAPVAAPAGAADAQLRIRRAASRLTLSLGWAALHEVPIPNGRRCDLLALRGDGGFSCIEVKSGPRDFLCDRKWPDYRAFCDQLYFAVGDDFPLALIPDDVGLIVACITSPGEAAVLREAPSHPLSPARRKALTQRFAVLAATRLACLEDPSVTASFRAALRAE